MSREGDWICSSSSCQHLNFRNRDLCQLCGYPKFGGAVEASSSYGINRTEVLAGDWYCNVITCGAHNYASRTSCHRCGASKYDYSGYVRSMMTANGCVYNGSGLPGWKDGDWICSRLGCGAHNYASRMECYKCGTPREFSG